MMPIVKNQPHPLALNKEKTLQALSPQQSTGTLNYQEKTKELIREVNQTINFDFTTVPMVAKEIHEHGGKVALTLGTIGHQRAFVVNIKFLDFLFKPAEEGKPIADKQLGFPGVGKAYGAVALVNELFHYLFEKKAAEKGIKLSTPASKTEELGSNQASIMFIRHQYKNNKPLQDRLLKRFENLADRIGGFDSRPEANSVEAQLVSEVLMDMFKSAKALAHGLNSSAPRSKE